MVRIEKVIDSLRINDNSDRHQNFLISEFLKLLSSIDSIIIDLIDVNELLEDVLQYTKSDKVRREINYYRLRYIV